MKLHAYISVLMATDVATYSPSEYVVQKAGSGLKFTFCAILI